MGWGPGFTVPLTLNSKLVRWIVPSRLTFSLYVSPSPPRPTPNNGRSLFGSALLALKKVHDPKGILNPDVLVRTSTASERESSPLGGAKL